MSLPSAPPGSQRGERPSGDAFETLVDASMQGSDVTVARSGNSRDPLNRPASAPAPNHVMRQPVGNSGASSAPPPQSNPGETGRDIRQSGLGTEQSSAKGRRGAKQDDPEIAPTTDVSDSPQAFSDTTDPDALPETVATLPAVAVPVMAPVVAATPGSPTEPVSDATEGPPARQAGALATSPANTASDPTLAADTEAVVAAILQETPDTGQAVRTVMQTGGALAAAVAPASPGAAKTAVKTLDDAPTDVQHMLTGGDNRELLAAIAYQGMMTRYATTKIVDTLNSLVQVVERLQETAEKKGGGMPQSMLSPA
ncbi:MAG TPA: hypothetical protein PLX43_02665, partial [Nitrobacter sp.]|nr:hypothetical protein [Nitrobacter sp.]